MVVIQNELFVEGYIRVGRFKSKLYYDRQSVGQSLLVPSPILGPRPDSCYCQTVDGLLIWAPSLTRGWVYRLQLLLAPASAVILGSESRRTQDNILLSQIRDSRNLEGQVPIFIFLGTG
jgi:hypothetical protein